SADTPVGSKDFCQSHVRLPARTTFFPYTTLFRSQGGLRSTYLIILFRTTRIQSHAVGRRRSYSHSDLRGDSRRNQGVPRVLTGVDRKSTRLNSSHVKISYAVFCLKKKITTTFTLQ